MAYPAFNDGLPDGWGRLLRDRKLRQLNIQPQLLTQLDRLAWVGSRGMGALVYRPEHDALVKDTNDVIDLDRLSEQSRKVLDDNPRAVLDELYKVGGSPQGARPKALVGYTPGIERLISGVDDLPSGYEHWLVKFPASSDTIDTGAIEQAYADMARSAGVIMPPTMLFPAKKGPGYFGTKRFDRDGNSRIHMHAVSGLLNADHTFSSITYEDLLKVTLLLTRRQAEQEQVFLRMIFNVLAHNRDDHTKNHSFLMSQTGQWSASPAYDVTFSEGPDGEHSLLIANEGRRPGEGHILQVAKAIGIDHKFAHAAIERVRNAVDGWPKFAAQTGVSRSMKAEIDLKLNGDRGRKTK
jgi:serine/threonine-protein kinase HipA